MNRQLLIFAFLLGSINCFAQQQLSLFGLSHLIDQNALNPAYLGNEKYEISIFPLTSSIYSDGPAYIDFIGNREANNVLRYPAEKLDFNQSNLFRAGSTIESFRFIFNQKNWAISAHHSANAKGIIDYSGALLAVGIQGNAPFIGQNVSLDSDFEIFSYEELGLGGAINIGKIRLGGRFKYLFGHAAAITRKSEVLLFTDEAIYQLSLDMNFQIDVAGQKGNSLSEFNFGPIGLNFSDNENVIIQSPELLFNLNDDLFNFSGNHGYAFDFGLNWSINEHFQISVSALDIGKINWKDTPRNYSANQTFEFDGLSLGQLTFDGSETISFDNAQDSLDIIDFIRTEHSFSTKLPAQFYLGLNYNLNEQWQFFSTLFYTSFHGNSFKAFNVGANYQLNPIFNLGATYGLMNEEHFLLGLNATVKIGPVQFYALTDNVFGVFNIEKKRTLNARVGLSFSFGQLEQKTSIEVN